MEIGIQDVADYILEDWLPALIGESDSAQYCDDLAVIADEYKKMPLVQQEKIIDAFKKANCIAVDCEDGYTLVRADYAYLNTSINKAVYADAFNAFILCDDLQELFDENIDVKNFLLKLGVCSFIRFYETSGWLSESYKENLRAGSRYTWDSNSAYNISNLDTIIKNITPEISKMLWEALNNLPNEYHTGTYYWDYSHSRTTRTIKAYFYLTLDTAQWLYNADGELITPADITYREIVELYGENKNMEEHINFKEDAVSKLPQDFQRVYSLMRKGVPAEALEQFATQYLEQQSESKIVLSDPTVGESVVYSNPFKNHVVHESVYRDDSINADGVADDTVIHSVENSSTKQSDSEVNHSTSITTHSDMKVKLGVWGEKKVISVLAKEYEKNGYDIFNATEDEFSAEKDNILIYVKRANNDQKNQCGYDILISENGEIAKYIEVKCKSNKQKESFPVHGAQWEFAKTLSLKGEGSKYCLCVVVYNDGSQTKTEICRIDDPYKAWVDGKLFADPINIVV